MSQSLGDKLRSVSETSEEYLERKALCENMLSDKIHSLYDTLMERAKKYRHLDFGYCTFSEEDRWKEFEDLFPFTVDGIIVTRIGNQFRLSW